MATQQMQSNVSDATLEARNVDKLATVAPARESLTVRVRIPLKLHTRGGRKLILTPDGSERREATPRVETPLLKALARAFRWRKLLEDGTHATVAELAVAEKINSSYVSRVLRLTLLAPHIVEQILTGCRSVAELQILLGGFPIIWLKQDNIVAPHSRRRDTTDARNYQKFT